ncbi:ABC transporter permease [Pelagicoccus sp. SDUM812002]|uniref:ABC transporter permease n=1 Tax=Pelagicoccus sp. SDUM812002 TaxID=3041266 RepID=UPI00280D008D|nr:ABC transporter permease [Pelagicoccus sp. SDUM812002]MDQ8187979.1 ABC transporter permease [Pelagicoccus sp. SDUM812002]
MNTNENKAVSPWSEAWHRLKDNRLAMFSLGYFVLIVLLCYLLPLLYPISPTDQSLSFGANPPLSKGIELRYDAEQEEFDEFITEKEFVELYSENGESDLERLVADQQTELSGMYFSRSDRIHLLGTDSHGRDLFARILQGGRVSLGVGFLATLVSLTIGVVYGSVSGYIGGRIDACMMRVVDVLYAIPFLIFVILLMVVFEASKHQLLLIFIAIGAVEWLTMARIVRGQVIHLKSQEFVDAARAIGVRPFTIIFRHLAPNTLGPVIVYATLLIPAVMLLESTLSFLGLGIQPPNASWGTLIKEGADKMTVYPWLLIIPSLFFSLTLFAMNFLGDGLRDALDVKSSKD